MVARGFGDADVMGLEVRGWRFVAEYKRGMTSRFVRQSSTYINHNRTESRSLVLQRMILAWVNAVST